MLLSIFAPVNSAIAADPSAPVAPTGLAYSNISVVTTTGVTQGTVEVDFSWTQPVDELSFTGLTFQITENTDAWPLTAADDGYYNSNKQDAETALGTTLHYIGLKQATKYYARVTYTNPYVSDTNNTSWNWSNVVSFTTPDVYWNNSNRQVAVPGFNSSAVIEKGAYYFKLQWPDVPLNYKWNPLWNLLYYELEYKAHGAKKWRMTNSSEDPFYLFDNVLYHNTRYDFRLRPWYADTSGKTRYGKWVSLSATTDSEGPPAYVLDIKAKKIRCNSTVCSVEITWKKPRDNGGHPVTKYEVGYYQSQSGDVPTTIVTRGRKVKINNLPRGTYWRIYVSAFNTLGSLDINDLYFSITSKGVVSQPR